MWHCIVVPVIFLLVKGMIVLCLVTSVNSIYEDTDNNIWVTFWRKGIFRYDRIKDTFVKYPVLGKENNPFSVFKMIRSSIG